MFSFSAEKSGRSSSGSVQGGSPVRDCRGDTDSGDVPRFRISALPVTTMLLSKLQQNKINNKKKMLKRQEYHRLLANW